MSEELFRLAVIRPAEATAPAPTIRLDAATDDDESTSKQDDKTIISWVTQLSELARLARQDGVDLEAALRDVGDVDLNAAQNVLHRILLDAPAGKDHLELADAVRGVAIAQLGEGAGPAGLTAMADAILVSSPGSRRPRRAIVKDHNDDTTKVVHESVSELLRLAQNEPSLQLRNVIGKATKKTALALSKVGLAEPSEQTVADAVAAINALPGEVRAAEWVTTATGVHLAQGVARQRLPNLPIAPPKPQPSGIAELKVVRQQVVRYEPGEVAHIENVLARESRERVHRTLDRSEDVSLFDTETTRNESRDLQSTERFELSTEARQQIEQSSEWEVGTSVSASYGPTLEVGLDASAGGASQRANATNRATSFSREVTDNAASAVTTRVREKRERTVLTEVEETNRHGIDNTESDQHVVGVYQWVDKIMQAQVFSYGSRLMYDLVLPEPGAFLTFAMTEAAKLDHTSVAAPPEWDVNESQLDAYMAPYYANKYGAVDVTPYPEAVTEVAQVEIKPPSEGAPFVNTTELTPPEGFYPIDAKVTAAIADVGAPDHSDLGWQRLVVTVNGHATTFMTDDIEKIRKWRGIPIHSIDPRQQNATHSHIPGKIAVDVVSNGIVAGAVTVRVVCVCSPDREARWRHEAYAQIRQAYEAQVSAYKAQLEQMAFSGGIDIEGRSPTENRRLERNELKKQVITAFTRDHFDFDAVEEDPDNGYPRLDLSRYRDQGAVIRLFEQAFEWAQMSWVAYPYYWSRTDTWVDKLATTGADPEHIEFLRAGAARVQIPVRLGFESAILHYQSTGEVWQGRDAPQVHDEDYLPIVQELAEQLDRPGTETPDGEPWEVRLPTDLVKLNPDGTLPTWHQDENGTWHPLSGAAR